jgi:hypothetical protein
MEWSRVVTAPSHGLNALKENHRRANQMDPWEVFSELCRRVVTEQNVYLDVLILKNGIEMQLMPLDEEEPEDD